MAFLGKTYTMVNQENFDTWLKSTGMPAESAAAMSAHKSTCKIVKNGDSYTISTSSPKGVKDTTFKPGVEFDDVIGIENKAIKTTFTVDGNTVTQVVKGDAGIATFKREFNGDDLVLTITGGSFDGVAKRFYKA